MNLLRQVGEPYNVSRAITLMGIILVEEGKYGDAERVLTESLANWRTIGNTGGMILALAGLAATAAGQGQMDRARTLYASLPTRHAENSLLLDRLMEVGFDRFMRYIHERIGDNSSVTIAPTTLEEVVNSVLEASPAITFQ